MIGPICRKQHPAISACVHAVKLRPKKKKQKNRSKHIFEAAARAAAAAVRRSVDYPRKQSYCVSKGKLLLYRLKFHVSTPV